MDEGLTWEEYLERTRQELIRIEKEAIRMRKELNVLKYMATHPNSGNLDDLMSVNGDEVIASAILRYNKEIETSKVLSSLYCDNSTYEIILENDKESTNEKPKRNDYEILFYDINPDENEVFSYLFDEDSRYKIIRKKDNKEIIDTSQKIRSSNKIKKLVK